MQVHFRSYQLRPTSRAGTVALATGVVVVGGALVVVGATLLLAAGAVGAVAGSGVLLYRRLTGRSSRPAATPLGRESGLDPRLEVFAPDERRLPPSEGTREP